AGRGHRRHLLRPGHAHPPVARAPGGARRHGGAMRAAAGPGLDPDAGTRGETASGTGRAASHRAPVAVVAVRPARRGPDQAGFDHTGDPMMRQLVFVHGRAQENKDAGALKEEWIQALEEGLARSGLALPLDRDRIRFPYYGDTLDQLSRDI